jgi:hypothetical protein
MVLARVNELQLFDSVAPGAYAYREGISLASIL